MKAKLLFIALTALLSSVSLADWPVWHNVGPGGGGWIQSILADRERPDVLYVGCDVGGFYRSDDGGKSYKTFNNGLQDYFVETIVQHPAQRDTLFLGCCSGLYKSTDGGHSWQWKRNGMPGIERHSWSAPISSIAFDARNPDIMFAACGNPRNNKGTHRGEVYMSKDGGESWTQQVLPGQLPNQCNIISIIADPARPGRLIISTNNGIFESTDNGAHWTPANSGLPHTRCRRLAMAPSNPKILYLSLWTNSGDSTWQGGIYRSDDGGRSWAPRLKGIPQFNAKKGEAHPLNTNVDRIAIHPANPDIVYAGGSAWVSATVYKTTDGGNNWNATLVNHNPGSYDPGWITFWGPSVYCLTLSQANPDIIYFGTSGHVIKTENAGNFWKQAYCNQFPDGSCSGSGLEVTVLHSLTLDPFQKDRVFGCYFDIGLLISDNAGQSFKQSLKGVPKNFSNSCFKLVFDPLKNGRKCWATFGNWGRWNSILMTSDDAGASWHALHDNTPGFSKDSCSNLTTAVINGKTHIFFTQENSGLSVSDNDGKAWQQRNNGLPKRPIRLFAVSPSQPQTMFCLYAATKDLTPQCYVSTNAGLQWSLAGMVPSSDHKQLIVAQDGTLYLASREDTKHPGGIFASYDNGKSWKLLLKDHFANRVAVDPRNHNRIIAGLNDNPYHDQSRGNGLFLSDDKGKTWTSLNSSTLPNTSIRAIEFDPFHPHKLWIATGGNSVFFTSLNK